MKISNVNSQKFCKISSGFQVIKNAARASSQVAEQKAISNHRSQFIVKMAKLKGGFWGAFRPLIDKVSKISDSFNVVVSTIKESSSIMKANTEMLLKKHPEMSKCKAKIQSLKKILPNIKEALKDIGGVNDVKAATKEKGVMEGVKEAGKAAVRVTTSTGVAVAATLVPLPGSTPIGWVVGEKLVNSVLGKPYTKKTTQVVKDVVQDVAQKVVK